HEKRTWRKRTLRCWGCRCSRASAGFDDRPAAGTRAVSSVGRAPARQAGGHWFEPSTAHSRTRWKRRVSLCLWWLSDHLLTTRRASGLRVSGRPGDHSVEHRDGLADLGGEEVAVAAVDQRAAVVVADTLGDQFRLHP